MQLGIDIGGTTISLGLVDNGLIIKKICRPSFAPDASQHQTFEHLESLIDELITPEVTGIGCGVPSVVDTVKGIVYDAANIRSWQECHLKEELEAKYGIPVHVNNDSNCYALGAYGAYDGKKPQMMLGVTLGTGVGAGLVMDGQIVNGPHAGVGELCCIPYLDGIAEDYCSSKFFLNKGVTPKDAGMRAITGDAEAKQMFDEYAGHLGKFIAIALYAYDADAIVLGGGVANNFPIFKESLMASINANFIYKNALADLKVLAMTDDSLAILGAAILN